MFSPRIPEGISYWVPKPSEIDEEGFGFFRDVWPIVGATVGATASVLSAERRALDYIAERATSPAEFESLATEIERADPDELDDALPLLQDSEEPWEGLDGLDVGVAGLVLALSNSGFYPAASCRSHQDSHSWSPYPVVMFASDRRRVELLEPLVGTAGCGFEAGRGGLICVVGPSVVETAHLAELLFSRRADFRSLPKTERRRRGGSEASPPMSTEATLF